MRGGARWWWWWGGVDAPGCGRRHHHHHQGSLPRMITHCGIDVIPLALMSHAGASRTLRLPQAGLCVSAHAWEGAGVLWAEGLGAGRARGMCQGVRSGRPCATAARALIIVQPMVTSSLPGSPCTPTHVLYWHAHAGTQACTRSHSATHARASHRHAPMHAHPPTPPPGQRPGVRVQHEEPQPPRVQPQHRGGRHVPALPPRVPKPAGSR